MLFVPPNVNTRTGKRNVDYYDRIKMVLSRVEERRNREEAKIADLFREKTREDHEIQLLTRPTEKIRRGPGRPPKLGTSLLSKSVRVVDVSWKEGGSAYPKRSSKVGKDHQVNPENIPPAGAYGSTKESAETSCEMIWNNGRGEEKWVGSYIDRKVPFNKKERALGLFHKSDYSLENADEIVNNIEPTDCSDWTEDEKELFRNEIFRRRKDLKALCGVMGKTMGQILSYYLGTYKKSNDYRLLKTVILDEKIEKARSSHHVVDQCAICEDGGSLLICDGCESEWHMTCTKPKLKEIPEGHWECELCVDRKFLEGRQRLIDSLGIFNNNGKRDSDAMEIDETPNKKSRKEILDSVRSFATKINTILTPRKATTETDQEMIIEEAPQIQVSATTPAADAPSKEQDTATTDGAMEVEGVFQVEAAETKIATDTLFEEYDGTKTENGTSPTEQENRSQEQATTNGEASPKPPDTVELEEASTKAPDIAKPDGTPTMVQDITKPEKTPPQEEEISLTEEVNPTEPTVTTTGEAPRKVPSIAKPEETQLSEQGNAIEDFRSKERILLTPEAVLQVKETEATNTEKQPPKEKVIEKSETLNTSNGYLPMEETIEKASKTVETSGTEEVAGVEETTATTSMDEDPSSSPPPPPHTSEKAALPGPVDVPQVEETARMASRDEAPRLEERATATNSIEKVAEAEAATITTPQATPQVGTMTNGIFESRYNRQ
ncbi:MAG: hypothetical protein SGILL_008095 [Bacillariaceae sp.]